MRVIINKDMQTDIDVLERVDEEVLHKEQNGIMVYNDDVNSFDHVIWCLVTYLGHTHSQAEQCAYIIHHSGKYVVKRGEYDELLPKCQVLCDYGLSAEIV